ncbi:hypothetical protein [Pseudomonas aeruginosa]|uniref:hypothetical protein n=1 Tax=Pseudomonas aeruginosa TaxID=287 RepID=UPI00283AA906|nr:hypothetical protein [Pseudomonas aeruginosa]WMU52636.1 hypothetical protein P4B31_21715 [Pseudomonas aeruginosa]
MNKANECTCPSGDGSLVHPCPAHPAVEQADASSCQGTNCGTTTGDHSSECLAEAAAGQGWELKPGDLCGRDCPIHKISVEQAGGDERDFQAKGAQEVPSPVSKEYDRHLIGLLRKGEALPGHQEEAADEIERLRDWNDHLNNTVLPNILNPNFLMLMKGGERLLDLCTKDGKFIGVSLNDMKDVFDWMVTHARIAPDHAALAQPSPTLPPFAEKVLTKLRRFNECAEDPGSGGVDIGRHWLDLLTQLRVQRSPALWEITQQGEDLLGTPQPSPASDLDPFNLAPHAEAFNEAPAEALKPEQAEAERPEVVAWQYRVTAGPQTGWSLWHPGKGEEFERSYTVERRPLMTVAQHERIVGELRAVIAQLRQHKNDYMDSGQETYRALQNEIREREAEIARLDGLVSGRTAERDAALAEVERLRQFERICEGLPQDTIDGGWTVQGIRGYAKRLEDQLKSALARVAELEKQEPVAWVDVDWIAQVSDPRGDGCTVRRAYGSAGVGLVPLYAAPVAQAQHSVPKEFIGRLSEFLAQRGATGKALLRELRALCAAAPGKEGV